TLTVGLGATTMDLDITTENNTLAGIRDAINASTDNPGVAATIVNADSGSYLILTAEDTGASNTITVTQAGGDGGLAALEYDPGQGLASLTESIAPQDAQIQIDGLDVISSSNTFSGAVQGVTINVFGLTGGTSEVLAVENDPEAAKSLVNDFVTSYNELIKTFDALTSYDAENEIGGPLLGDSTLRSIRDQVRREMSAAVQDLDAPFSMLGEVGIEVQLDGTLSVDDTRLDTVLGEDFVKFGQLFSTTDGFATRLHALTDGYLESDGIIESRTQGLTASIDGINDDREALNERLASLETRLLRQFNALDSLLAQLSSTSNFLTQQLATLPTPGRE
ncbi:MAG: flagellar filament capping protein FliD, partial [Pseudomonadota bacterium]